MAEVIFLLLGGATAYLFSHIVLSCEQWKQRLTHRGTPPSLAQAQGVVIKRLSTGLWLLLCSTSALTLSNRSPGDYGLQVTDFLAGLGPAALASLLVIPVVVVSACKPTFQQVYPEIRRPDWTPRWVVMSAASWVIYLLGYEFFFRGFLFFLCLQQWGIGAALTVTTIGYTLAHLHKPTPELIACVPMGLGFGYLACVSGGFWVPWILHTAIALSSETASAYHHPNISWWHQPPQELSVNQKNAAS